MWEYGTKQKQVVMVNRSSASWAVDGLGPVLVAFLRPRAGVEAVVVVDNSGGTICAAAAAQANAPHP